MVPRSESLFPCSCGDTSVRTSGDASRKPGRTADGGTSGGGLGEHRVPRSARGTSGFEDQRPQPGRNDGCFGDTRQNDQPFGQGGGDLGEVAVLAGRASHQHRVCGIGASQALVKYPCSGGDTATGQVALKPSGLVYRGCLG